MINIQLILENPFVDYDYFRGLYSTHGRISENKTWEIEIHKDNYVIGIGFRFTIKQDHAGLRFNVGLLGYAINFNIYDNRHWDYEKNQWEM